MLSFAILQLKSRMQSHVIISLLMLLFSLQIANDTKIAWVHEASNNLSQKIVSKHITVHQFLKSDYGYVARWKDKRIMHVRFWLWVSWVSKILFSWITVNMRSFYIFLLMQAYVRAMLSPTSSSVLSHARLSYLHRLLFLSELLPTLWKPNATISFPWHAKTYVSSLSWID